MNFTVTSKGRQFDRLGLMYLGDIEVFRTSTAEPTANGIVWSYIKEMDQYNTLWKTEQKILFDLGNLVDKTYTGSFNTTLTATFFTVPESRATADNILPISSRQSSSNKPSAFSVPSQNASVAVGDFRVTTSQWSKTDSDTHYSTSSPRTFFAPSFLFRLVVRRPKNSGTRIPFLPDPTLLTHQLGP